MKNAECVEFLQWALPRLAMRWQGFRKVRRQVCRRIARRLRELGVPDTAAYRDFLEHNPDEWQFLDGACRITISRFYRDRGVFDALGANVLPAIARAARARGERELACLSVGCASGEEAYSLKILWELGCDDEREALALRITGMDSHPVMLERARRGCFHPGSLRDLPESWRGRAFERGNGEACLRAEFRGGIDFVQGDVRRALPTGPFDLILCRNLAFTYFVDALQHDILMRLHAHMRECAALVVGIHESLPEDCVGFRPWDGARCTYRRVSAA
jgi:chemotaxis protein methyltransferase CheR